MKFNDLVLSEFARELLLFSITRFYDYRHCLAGREGSLKRVLDTLAVAVGLTRFFWK